ncbi:MAG: DUF1622 domain-containing protein [Candidatus Limnocylindrales bacterium]
MVEAVGRAIDVAGVVAIAGGIALVLAFAARSMARGESGIYGRFRQQLGRVILLGLELLVAADIIRTVAVAPTLGSVVVLGVIVLVRTFLSFSLEVELTGQWRLATHLEAPDAERRGRRPATLAPQMLPDQA